MQLSSPAPIQGKSPINMQYPSHMSAQGSSTTPNIEFSNMLDYKDILDERFATPNVMIK